MELNLKLFFKDGIENRHLLDEIDVGERFDAKLTTNDKRTLAVYIEALKTIEVYDLSKLRSLLNKILVNENKSISNWKSELQLAISACNEDKYSELINNAELENND